MTTQFSLARRLAAGETVHTGWCALPYPVVAETIAREGFAAVTIDQQHGLWDTATTATGIAAIRQAGAAPIVRIPVGDYAVASRALDFGAEGVIAPMINTAEDARAFVAVAKYPPTGERSWGPQRAMTLGGFADQKTYLREANALTVTFAMIETRTALDNLDAIAATEGIDALFVGPSDLSIALSNGGEVEPHSAAVEHELDRVVAAARKAKKIPGLYCASAERALFAAKRGFRFMAVGSDLGFLRAGTAAQVKALGA
ncbi:MAG TPA: aldolase/citrate lyase family protein [Xanthobacteraceae bacterium]